MIVWFLGIFKILSVLFIMMVFGFLIKIGFICVVVFNKVFKELVLGNKLCLVGIFKFGLVLINKVLFWIVNVVVVNLL